MKIKKKGFIALTSLLVISAAALAITISISVLGIGEANASLSFKKGREALKIAESCAEESLLRLRNDLSWDPNGAETQLPGLTGPCNIDVSGSGANQTIDITGTISGPPQYVKKLQLTVKRAGNSINILTWKEVE